jgi:hypothetical protein
VPRYLALVEEWRANPPAHWLVAAALKYREPKRSTEERRQPTVAEMSAAFPGGKL